HELLLAAAPDLEERGELAPQRVDLRGVHLRDALEVEPVERLLLAQEEAVALLDLRDRVVEPGLDAGALRGARALVDVVADVVRVLADLVQRLDALLDAVELVVVVRVRDVERRAQRLDGVAVIAVPGEGLLGVARAVAEVAVVSERRAGHESQRQEKSSHVY